jgi:putative flippase GtrA
VFRLIRRLLNDQRVRFLIVGGFNTVFGFALFVVFELLVGQYIGYFVSLYTSYVLAVIVAFLLHRHYTYRVTGTGNILIDFLRFASVSLVSLAVNTIALPVLVEIVGITPIIAQAFIVVVTTIVSYFGHKLFSFRRKPMAVADEAALVAPRDGTTEDQARR